MSKFTTVMAMLLVSSCNGLFSSEKQDEIIETCDEKDVDYFKKKYGWGSQRCDLARAVFITFYYSVIDKSHKINEMVTRQVTNGDKTAISKKDVSRYSGYCKKYRAEEYEQYRPKK